MEPFCPVDIGMSQQADITVQVAEGATLGHDALREQVLKELEQEQRDEE